MPRSLSSAALRAVLARETGEAVIVLLTLSNAGLPQPIRVCSDALPITSRGALFQPYPFEAVLAKESGDSPPQATLKIDNIDLQITQACRSIIGSTMAVRVEVVLASTPDTVEAGPADFTLRNVTYDAMTVQGQLMFEDLLNEPFPSDEFGPGTTPGVFA